MLKTFFHDLPPQMLKSPLPLPGKSIFFSKSAYNITVSPTFLTNNQVWFWSQKMPQIHKIPRFCSQNAPIIWRVVPTFLSDNQIVMWIFDFDPNMCHEWLRESRLFFTRCAHSIEYFPQMFGWLLIVNLIPEGATKA